MAEIGKGKETAESFAQRLGLMLADSMTMLSLSLGSKIGLVDKLLTYKEPKTCREIAVDSGFKERYLQEWLNVMVTGGIVDLHENSDGNKFLVPQSRRMTLNERGYGMAAMAESIALLAQVHGQLGECFKEDGPAGISRDSYNGFYQEWKFFSLQGRIDQIIGSLDSVPNLVKSLESGISMCDLGCGSGFTTLQIARKFPNSQVYGIDIREEAIANAQKAATEKALSNCHFQVADIINMPADWTEKWDFVIMYEVLHDLPNVAHALSEFYRIVKKGAYVAFIEPNFHTNLKDNVNNPDAPYEYGFSLFHCVPVSLTTQGGDAMGAGWGKEKAMRMIKQAGFTDVKIAKELVSNEVLISGKK